MRYPFRVRPVRLDRLDRPVLSVCTLALLVGVAGTAGGEEPAHATAKVECAHVSEPGRVRCEVEVRVPAGTVLKWADVVVTKSPSFAAPLRARVGPLEASAHEETVWRWAIALAARARGSGELTARIRLVSCVKDACVPTELEVRGEVVVGE